MSILSRYLNPFGYRIAHIGNKGLMRKAVFDFTLDDFAPLTYMRYNGELVRPDRHFVTDKGSIPVCLRWLIPSDTYERPYLFHDSAYLHHGLWFQSPFGHEFIFKPMSMDEANRLLSEMMDSEGAWRLTRNTVFKAVKWFGRFSWNNGERRVKAGSQQAIEDDNALGVG